jgi:hypothetical protein
MRDDGSAALCAARVVELIVDPSIAAASADLEADRSNKSHFRG